MIKTRKYFIGLALVFSLLFVSSFTTVNACEKKDAFVYTAIGDAIALGVGGQAISDTELVGYDDYVFEKLQAKNKKDEVILRNVSSRLDTSSDLLNKLMNDPTLINAVRGSDLVTVDIGNNNLLLPIWPVLAGVLMGYIAPEEGMAQISAATPVYQAAVDQFAADWPLIVKRINKLAPDATIYVNTMYNPFPLDYPLYGLADIYIKQINAVIQDKHYKHDYKVADVYTAFYNYEAAAQAAGISPYYMPVIHQFDSPDVVHPTPLGYKMIADLMKLNNCK